MIRLGATVTGSDLEKALGTGKFRLYQDTMLLVLSLVSWHLRQRMVIEERVVVHDIQDDEVRGCPDSVQDKVLSWDLGRRKKLETCTWIERETSLRFGELGGGGGGGGGSRVRSQLENNRGSPSIEVTRVAVMPSPGKTCKNWSCKLQRFSVQKKPEPFSSQHIRHKPLFTAHIQMVLQDKQDIVEAKDFFFSVGF